MVILKHVNRWLCHPMKMMIIGGLLIVPGISFGSDLSGHIPQDGDSTTTQTQNDPQLDAGHRYIEGTVEEINENTLRVDAGEAGGMSPRYLNLDNSQGKDSFEVGDMVQIEVNAQNKVVRFQPRNKDGDKH
ncbi:MAG TPA: hypothetical protein PKK23_02105 [Nitrospirales bacterium]|nr:hypothetical protein [Nitrospiraceae bacterium]HNP27809.1 hypothetical protein [Nitrospirales bacterium]